MLYIVGLGLNIKGISKEGLEAVKRCKKIYLENYTVEFPYETNEISEIIEKEIELADRNFVESCKIVDEARRKDVALLVYGSPLFATTHIVLMQECEASKVKCEFIYSASVFDAIAETGLQLYKFGKIASMPKWDLEKNYTPDSFMEIVKQNQSIDAHSLILVDIGLNFKDAFQQLKKSADSYKIKLSKLVVCQQLGTRRGKIMYRTLDEFAEFSGVRAPYCIIIPSKLHHVEVEVLRGFE